MANRVAIVGVGLSLFSGHRPDVNHPEMVNESVRAALADAQMNIKDVDAVFAGSMDGFELGHLDDHWVVDGSGGFMKPGFRVSTGGTTGASMFSETFYSVASGLFDTAMCVAYQKQDEGNSTAAISCAGSPGMTGSRSVPMGAIGVFAQHAQSYMKKSGATEEHAAMVRLKADRNACRNIHSHLKLGLKSIDDYLKSRVLV